MAAQQEGAVAAEIVVQMHGAEWKVPEPQAVLQEYADRAHWRYMIGCKRCHEACTQLARCTCCRMAKANRPFDPEGGHDRIGAASDFIASLRDSLAGGRNAVLRARRVS